MALIKCPECGKEISDKATACIQCGCPMEQQKENRGYKIYFPILRDEEISLVRKLFSEVLGYSENEIKWFIEKGGCMNIASDLTLNEAKLITIPFDDNDIQVYLRNESDETIFWNDIGIYFNKSVPQNHYYDRPVVSRKHLSEITTLVKKEIDKQKLDEKRRLEREKKLQNSPEMQKAIKENELKNAQKKSEKAQAEKDALVSRLEREKEAEANAKTKCVLWIICWSIICIWSFSVSKNGSHGWIVLISFLFAICGIGMLVLTKGSVEQMENDIKIASKSVEEYQKIIDSRLAYSKMQSEKLRTEKELKHPKCPNCGSMNTNYISTLNRAISVGTVGLASSKIGKQYECKKCKYKW